MRSLLSPFQARLSPGVTRGTTIRKTALLLLAGLLTVSISGCGGGGGGGAANIPAVKPKLAVPSFPKQPEVKKGACMPSGAQIINDAGIVQIDENFYCLEFKQRMDIWLASGSPVTITTPGFTDEVLAIGAASVPVTVESKPAANQYVLSTRNDYNTGGAAVPIYIYGRASNAVVTSAGLEIRNGSGEITFQSGRPIAKVVHASRVPDAPEYNGGPGLTHGFDSLPSGNYAVALSAPRAGLFFVPDAQGVGAPILLMSDLMRATANGATLELLPYKIVGIHYEPPHWDIQQPIGGWMTIFDVTGL